MSELAMILGPEETKRLLPIRNLCDEIREASVQYANGLICSPERQVLPLISDAVMLSMPATSSDVSIHKLVNVVPDNLKCGLPTINGIVSVYSSQTGKPQIILDGPTVTAQRTAAVTILAIQLFKAGQPKKIAIFGTGKQAAAHLEAIAEVFPSVTVEIYGISQADVVRFIDDNQFLNLKLEAGPESLSDDVDVVVTLTTSKKAVYNLDASIDRLIVGVGAFKPEMCEIGANTIGSSSLYSDDPVGARHEAGDFIQAGVNWDLVQPLSEIVKNGYRRDVPVIFKSVGTAAWDLAAARCAVKTLKLNCQV